MSTGVRILPRDSTGYIYRDQYATYQMARAMTEHFAAHYPNLRDELAQDARNINRLHLRHLLTQAIRAKGGMAASDHENRFWRENLPKAERHLWEYADAHPVVWNCTPP